MYRGSSAKETCASAASGRGRKKLEWRSIPDDAEPKLLLRSEMPLIAGDKIFSCGIGIVARLSLGRFDWSGCVISEEGPENCLLSLRLSHSGRAAVPPARSEADGEQNR